MIVKTKCIFINAELKKESCYTNKKDEIVNIEEHYKCEIAFEEKDGKYATQIAKMFCNNNELVQKLNQLKSLENVQLVINIEFKTFGKYEVHEIEILDIIFENAPLKQNYLLN